MATNTIAVQPAAYHSVVQAVKALRCTIKWEDGATYVYTVGTVPAGSIIIGGCVAVAEVWNWGTNNLINVGIASDDNDFATIMSLTTVGIIVFDEMATATDWYCAVDTPIIATMACTGTQATTGAGAVIVQYVEGPVLDI